MEGRKLLPISITTPEDQYCEDFYKETTDHITVGMSYDYKYNTAISKSAKIDFVWLSKEDITTISCYLTPSDPISDFLAKLDAIEDAAHHTNRHLNIGGDFNGKAME